MSGIGLGFTYVVSTIIDTEDLPTASVVLTPLTSLFFRSSVFYDASRFNQLLEDWDVSTVTSMSNSEWHWSRVH